MSEEWAENHLRTIRTLMEKAAVYRRALGPIALLTGAFGVVGGVLGWGLKVDALGAFVIYWTLWAIVTLVAVFFAVRAQAMRDGEAIWSPPTRRVAVALAPPLTMGVGISVVTVFQSSEFASGHISVISLWIALFGVALTSAGFFMQRGIRFFGVVFLLVGMGLGLADALVGLKWNPHLLMGLAFGGLHLVYGAYLRITERQ